MHIEKNVFVNILNMVMDVEGGEKDSIKTRMNIVLFCDHQNIKLLNDELWVAKSKVTFALYIYKKKAQYFVYKWFKSLWFFDRYASNIARLLNLEKCILYEMKSHDYHVFMKKLISIEYRVLLPRKSINHKKP